jgi:hypothetical protein
MHTKFKTSLLCILPIYISALLSLAVHLILAIFINLRRIDLEIFFYGLFQVSMMAIIPALLGLPLSRSKLIFKILFGAIVAPIVAAIIIFVKTKFYL